MSQATAAVAAPVALFDPTLTVASTAALSASGGHTLEAIALGSEGKKKQVQGKVSDLAK